MDLGKIWFGSLEANPGKWWNWEASEPGRLAGIGRTHQSSEQGVVSSLCVGSLIVPHDILFVPCVTWPGCIYHCAIDLFLFAKGAQTRSGHPRGQLRHALQAADWQDCPLPSIPHPSTLLPPSPGIVKGRGRWRRGEWC